MSRSSPPLPPEIGAFLEWESAIPPVPGSVRSRAVARARAALAIGRGIPVALRGPLLRTRLGSVLAAVLITAAAAGAIGYELGGRYGSARNKAIAHEVLPGRGSDMASPATVVVPSSVAAAAGPDPQESRPRLEPDELLLLREASSALADGDFAAALIPIHEHALRFEDGVLAEEREALRIRALAGLDQTEEVRRAADAFEARFPHSVLLRPVRRMTALEP